MSIFSNVFSVTRLTISIVAFIFGSNANASLISSASDIGSSSSIIDFSDFPMQQITLGPVQIGSTIGNDVVFTATNTFGVAGFSAELYGLGLNGVWFGGTFAWVNPGTQATMRFTFANGPVSSVGALLNYCIDSRGAGCGTGGVVIRALDNTFNILESHRLDTEAPINTPSAANEGAFRGISRHSADIFAFEISGASVLDNLTFSAPVSHIPEPGSVSLLIFGSAILASIHLRNRRNSSVKRCQDVY